MKITIMVPKFHENSQKRAKDDCQNGRRGNEHSLVFMLFGVTAVRTACTAWKTKARKIIVFKTVS